MANFISKETNIESGLETTLFSYHKQSGYVGLICAFLVIIIVESVAISLLLHKWSPVFHVIHLLLAFITFMYLVVDLRAVVKNPIILSNNELSLKIGIRPRILISLENIQEIIDGSINYEKDRKNKDILDLSLIGFDLPTFELVLREPLVYKGKKGAIRRIFFTVDDKGSLYSRVKPYTKVI